MLAIKPALLQRLVFAVVVRIHTGFSLIGNASTSRYAMFLSQIKQLILSNFHPLKVVGRGSETPSQSLLLAVTILAMPQSIQGIFKFDIDIKFTKANTHRANRAKTRGR